MRDQAEDGEKLKGQARPYEVAVHGREEAALEISIIFKIGAVGILVSVLSQVLKHSGREEQAFLASLAGLVIVLFWVLPYIYELFDTIKNLFML